MWCKEFNRNESDFWITTPLTFNELMRVYKQINGLNDEENSNEQGFIDEILF